ncbi:MAG: hypothetical protein R3183_09345 [Oleiphilaceae bacterium]|nr:hypothetical protein [Oleiphilaceae bacterium]
MASDKDNDEQEVLTEEQRIAMLEKKAGTSRIVLFVIALLLIIVTSVSITALTMLVLKGNEAASNQELVTLKQQISDLQEKLGGYEERLLTLSAEIPELKGKISNSSNTVLQTMLIEQEQQNQQFLTTLRSATFDLAHMVPGSRAWLDLYSTEIDDAIAQSQARVQRLRSLKSSTPIDKGDPFFGDDF